MTPLKQAMGFEALDSGRHGTFGREQDVCLLPDGETTLQGGQKILVDLEAGESVVAAFEGNRVDLPFDVNHSTILLGSKGHPAEAVGWITRLWHDKGRGIMSRVKWTEKGASLIEERKYRYISPVFMHEPGGRVRKIHSAALVTKPATPEAQALLAAMDMTGGARDSKLSHKEKPMNGLIATLLQEGSEPAVATAEQIVGEVKAALVEKGIEIGDGADLTAILSLARDFIKQAGAASEDKENANPVSDEQKEDSEVAASVRSTLGLAAKAGKVEIMRALSDAQGHVGYVKVSDYRALADRVAHFETVEKTRTATELVTTALAEGKLNKNDEKQMAWANDRAANDPDGFKMLMDGATAIVPQGETAAPAAPTGGAGEEKLIQKALGDHDGNEAEAMIALQSELIDTECTARGCDRKHATAALERKYPKVFA